MFSSTHDEALSRLCFVCGDLIKDSISYEVETHLELIRVGLNNSSVESVTNVTPRNFCKNCRASFCHVVGGTTARTTRILREWTECGTECGTDCTTCTLLVKQKQVRGRPPKKKVKLFSS